MDFCLAALLVLCAISTARAAGNVYHLNEQDFGAYLRDKDVMLVDFYAPWCPHCKELDPELDAAADTMAAKSSYVFAKVDCANDGKSLCDRMKVPGYPTLKVFKYGRWVGDYTGGHDRGSILNYVESVTSPTNQQASLTAQPVNNPATLGQAIESRPQLAPSSQAFRPQAPYQLHLSYQSQYPQAQAARPAAPYFNSFFDKNTGSNTNPSLLGSFYKEPKQPSYEPAKVPKIVPSRSPDSLREKFGSLAALRVYQAKLQMLAAYKNWHRRIRIFQERVKEFKAQQYGIKAKTDQPPPPSSQVAAYQGAQPPSSTFANPPYYQAEQQATQSHYYQPYNQFQQPAAYAYYRSKLKSQRNPAGREPRLPPRYQFQTQSKASPAFTNPRFQTLTQAPFVNRPAKQAAQSPTRFTQQTTQSQTQQQLSMRAPNEPKAAAVNSPGTSLPSEDLESLKADLANSLVDFAKQETSKDTSVKSPNSPKQQATQTPQTQNNDNHKQVNSDPDNQDLSSLGLDDTSGKQSNQTEQENNANNDNISSAEKNNHDERLDKTEGDSKDKTVNIDEDTGKSKSNNADDEKEMNEDVSSGDIPEKKNQIAAKPKQ